MVYKLNQNPTKGITMADGYLQAMVHIFEEVHF
jgi:hypothetical protein